MFSKLFKKKKREIEVISLEELPSHLSDLKSNHNEFISNSVNTINQSKETIFNQLDILQNDKLENSNIPTKAIHIMKGNRENYIRKLKTFFDELEFPNEDSNLEEYSQEYAQKIEDLGQEIRKNAYVLGEFFRDSTRNINKEINLIETNLIKNYQEWQNSGASAYLFVNRLANKLEDSKEKQVKVSEKMVELKKEITDLEVKKQKYGKKIKELETSQEFNSHKENLVKIELNSKKLASLKSEIKNNFSNFDKSFKKIAHSGLNQELVKEYLDDPVEAILNDDKKILDVLEKLDFSKEKESKQSQIKKSIKVCNESFDNWKQKIRDVMDESENLDRKVASSTIILNIKEQKGFVEHLDLQISQINQDLDKLEGYGEQVKPSLVIRDINKHLEKLYLKVKNETN